VSDFYERRRKEKMKDDAYYRAYVLATVQHLDLGLLDQETACTLLARAAREHWAEAFDALADA